MNKKSSFILILIALILGILACNIPGVVESSEPGPTTMPESEAPPQEEQIPDVGESVQEAEPPEEVQPSSDEVDISESPPVSIEPGERIQPSDLVYLGAFRLPDTSGELGWDYSGHGLTYYPDGDPGGSGDGFPGSLFGVGHDHQLFISEISIPAPVNSHNLADLSSATTLQPFADLSSGIFVAEEMSIPRIGIEYLPPQGDQTTAKLHYVWGQHIQDFEYSHGWAELDLTNPQPAGPWFFDGYTNYVTNDYLFEIPQEWSDAYAPGMRLATGRAREGLWSGRGPGLFAYAPWQEGNPPPPNATLTTITPLLLYGVQEPELPDIFSDETMAMNGYLDADHWMGGAWLTAGDSSALIFVGTKALGSDWYGYANGVVWPHDCAENDTCPEVPEWPYDDRGFWAEDYEAQIIFYDPAEIAAVATGQIETWEPQPYATMSIQDVLFDPELNFGEYKRDFIGAAAFDRANGILFVIERLGDEYKSVVHMWRVSGE
jgi:hypothetical protein